MPKNIIADTGFWIALFNERDQHHADALRIECSLEHFNLVIPWPTLYETINTRFAKRAKWRQGLKVYLDKSNTLKIDDAPYKDRAIEEVITPLSKRYFSAVDFIIRSILEDPNVKTDALITFNEADFSDVCYGNGIELVSRQQAR